MNYFRVAGAHEAVLGFTGLFSVSFQGDDIQDFDSSWDQALLSASEVTEDAILESLYKGRIRESDQLRTVLAMYEQKINQDRSKPNCHKRTMVKRHVVQKMRT